MLKGLPLAYQRDLQESVAPLFDAVGVYASSLRVMAGLVGTLEVDVARMADAASEGYTTATAVADALVRRGVAFRTAHHIVGSLVAQAEGAGLGLDEVPDGISGSLWAPPATTRSRRSPRTRGSATRSGTRPPSREHSRPATSSVARRRRASLPRFGRPAGGWTGRSELLSATTRKVVLAESPPTRPSWSAPAAAVLVVVRQHHGLKAGKTSPSGPLAGWLVAPSQQDRGL